MAGVAGLEPAHGGIKTRCLTNLATPQLNRPAQLLLKILSRRLLKLLFRASVQSFCSEILLPPPPLRDHCKTGSRILERRLHPVKRRLRTPQQAPPNNSHLAAIQPRQRRLTLKSGVRHPPPIQRQPNLVAHAVRNDLSRPIRFHPGTVQPFGHRHCPAGLLKRS